MLAGMIVFEWIERSRGEGRGTSVAERVVAD